jgi:hypothetical protein
MAEDEILFAVLAEKKDDLQPLYLHGLSVTKLHDHRRSSRRAGRRV